MVNLCITAIGCTLSGLIKRCLFFKAYQTEKIRTLQWYGHDGHAAVKRHILLMIKYLCCDIYFVMILFLQTHWRLYSRMHTMINKYCP